MIKNVCVYAGSNNGIKEGYKNAAKELGLYLVKNNMNLIYGGGKFGLMGILADTVIENGGKVTGIIPKSIKNLEVSHDGISKLIVVSSMHERKAKMEKMADAFIVLPGGLGTFDEMFEIYAWAQLGYHKKPCGIFNVCGFFDDVLKFIKKASYEGFLRVEVDSLFITGKSPQELFERFQLFKKNQ